MTLRAFAYMVTTTPGLFYLWSPWPCSWLYHTSGNQGNPTQALLPPLFKKKGKRLTQTHLLEGWQLKRN